jgi:hypothetical protein
VLIEDRLVQLVLLLDHPAERVEDLRLGSAQSIGPTSCLALFFDPGAAAVIRPIVHDRAAIGPSF